MGGNRRRPQTNCGDQRPSLGAKAGVWGGGCSSPPAVIRTARPTCDKRGGTQMAVRGRAKSASGSRGDIAAGRRCARRRGRSGAGVATGNRRAVDDRRVIGRRAAPPTIAPAATQRAAAQRQHDRQDQHLLHDSNSHRNKLVPSQGSCPKELYTTIGVGQTQHRCFSATICRRTCRANRSRGLCPICQRYRRAGGDAVHRTPSEGPLAHRRQRLRGKGTQHESIGESSLWLGC